jgi:peptidyl-prolyl cis-trans isomerase SurA
MPGPTTTSVKNNPLLFLLLAGLLSLGLVPRAHAQVIDKIMAVVGEDVVLLSDMDGQYAYFIANGQKDDGTLRCQIMEKLIIELLLLNKAKQDSLEVSEDQIASELDRKLDYFIQGYGGVKPLEDIYGKPLIEIREELKPDIKDQLLTEKMRQNVIAKVAVTPREVKRFYGEIPKDSLPYLPAEVEIFHIVAEPKPTSAAKLDAKEYLNVLRTKILDGKISFEEAAKQYSVDFGSARLGGDLGEFGRGRMVPEFEEVAFKSKEGDVSEVFESPFGFHIMKIYKRVGETVGARHILISPRLDSQDDSLALARLMDIRNKIVDDDTVSFQTAAIRWSDDEGTKECGGCIKNPQTGELRIPLDLLDADFYLKVDEMAEGEVSEPLEWIQPDGKRAFHLILLHRRIAPHIANLNDDYQRIQDAALQARQAVELEEWFMTARKNVYIEIKDPACREVLTNWIQ